MYIQQPAKPLWAPHTCSSLTYNFPSTLLPNTCTCLLCRHHLHPRSCSLRPTVLLKSSSILLLLLLKPMPLHGLPMLPSIKRTFLIKPTRPWSSFLAPDSTTATPPPAPFMLGKPVFFEHTDLLLPTHSICTAVSPVQSLSSKSTQDRHSSGQQGQEDKIFKVGIISEGLHMWSPELQLKWCTLIYS